MPDGSRGPETSLTRRRPTPISTRSVTAPTSNNFSKIWSRTKSSPPDGRGPVFCLKPFGGEASSHPVELEVKGVDCADVEVNSKLYWVAGY